jgi:DNA-binding MarR family transcriptional regulator
VNRVEELLKKLKPILGEKADQLWLIYANATPKMKQNIQGMLEILASKELGETFQNDKIVLEPPSEDVSSGGYELGQVYHGDNPLHFFGLIPQSMLGHLGIWGMTSAGKTNVVSILLENLQRSGKHYLVFDWKRNFRDLLALPEFKDVQVYTVGRNVSPLFWNPLKPPKNADVSTWLKGVIEVAEHALFLGHGVERLLQTAIYDLYIEYGVYNDPQEYPTLKDVEAKLDNLHCKGREAQWLDSARRAVGTLNFGGFGQVLDVRNPPEIDLTKNIILELDSLTESEKIFFTEVFLLYLYHIRLSEPEREKFKHCTIIEEAHNCLLREKTRITGKESIIEVVLRQIRELGESLVIIDQTPSQITPTALANIHTNIVMKLSYSDDVVVAGKLLGLQPDQFDYIKNLKTGWAIMRVPYVPKPFLLRFPLFLSKKSVIGDSDVSSQNRSYSAETIIEQLRETTDELLRVLRGEGKREIKERTGLTQAEEAIIKDVAEKPLSSIVERYHRLNLSAYQGNKGKDSLTKQGLVQTETISSGNGRIKIVRLTPEGEKVAQTLGFGVEHFPKNASPEHELWKKKVAEYLKTRGYEVEEEKHIGDRKFTDVVARKDGENIAVEIETGKSDALQNINKNLHKNFDKVVSFQLKSNSKESKKLNITKAEK